MEKKDTYEIMVEPFHADFTGRMYLSLLGNHLLNAAGRHSHRRGWGISELNQGHHTWVLSRLCIEMQDMPRQNERVVIQTWVESVMHLFTHRNFAILRPDGTPYGYARSVWAMIDTETRKPCDLLAYADGDILRYVVSDEENQCPIQGHGRFRFRDTSLARIVDTYYSDIDINGHVNSMKYIEHILDLFPRQRFEEEWVSRFEIAYKTEAFMGDSLSLFTQTCEDAPNTVDVEITRPPVEVVCQARVVFSPRERQ